MPLEINEIDIAMRVTENGVAQRAGGGSDAQRRDEDREELIEECVRRVLQALKAEREP